MLSADVVDSCEFCSFTQDMPKNETCSCCVTLVLQNSSLFEGKERMMIHSMSNIFFAMKKKNSSGVQL